MRNTLTAAIFAASLVTLFAGNASAQSVSNDVMTSCNQSVGQMKFDGWPADPRIAPGVCMMICSAW